MKASTKIKTVLTIGVSLSFGLGMNAFAQGLVYQPINPAFGGSPLNNGFLVGTAQIQNQFTGSGGGGGGAGIPSIDFPDINIDLGDIGGDNSDDPAATPDTSGDDTSGTDTPAASILVQ